MSEVNFVETDGQEIWNQLVSGFEAAYGETFYPGDERRIFLLQQFQLIVGIYNSINDVARQNLLRYARGAVLDAIGESRDTPRIPAQKATTVLRYTLSAAQAIDVIIPSGSRATPDGSLYFATKQVLVITAGQLYGDVSAEAAEGGRMYNGFTAGQIKNLVEPIAYVASVSNTTTSSGGTDIETDDDGVNVWSGYRERIREAPAKQSTAGHEDGYIYWAKTASADIQDVAVTSPDDGEILIIVLMKNGELPSSLVLDAVLAACNDKKVRPITDHVTVAAPETATYDIDLTYYISQDNAAGELSIKGVIESPGGIVDQYKLWQRSKMDRAINPDYLKQLMLNAGANRVDVTDPVYTAIDGDTIAVPGTVTITYGGLI